MPVPITAECAIPRRLHKDAVFDHLVAAILDGRLHNSGLVVAVLAVDALERRAG